MTETNETTDETVDDVTDETTEGVTDETADDVTDETTDGTTDQTADETTVETGGELTVACTSNEDETETRHEIAREELLPYYRGVEERTDGYRFMFEGSPDALDAAADFVRRESQCCSFASFRIEYEPPYDEVALSFVGPEGTRDLLREGFSEAFEEISVPS